MTRAPPRASTRCSRRRSGRQGAGAGLRQHERQPDDPGIARIRQGRRSAAAEQGHRNAHRQRHRRRGRDGHREPHGRRDGRGRQVQLQARNDQLHARRQQDRHPLDDRPGTVESQHVSVLLDHSVPAAAVPAIKEAITNAAGIQAKRGDTISIGQVAFAKPATAAAAASEHARATPSTCCSGIGASIFLFFTTRSLRRRENGDDRRAGLAARARGPDAPLRARTRNRAAAGAGDGRRRRQPTAATRNGNGARRRSASAGRSSSSPTATPTGSPSSCATGCRRASRVAGESPRNAAGAAAGRRATAARDRADLTGARKAAVLMAALGSERAANVLQRMRRGRDREPLDGDGRAELGRRRDDRVDLRRARRAGQRRRARRVAGGLDFARERDRARARARARRGAARAAVERASRRTPFEFLRRVPPERIAALLRGESPQTIALVLASLHTEAGRRRCWPACPSASSPTSRCASPAWARPARR